MKARTTPSPTIWEVTSSPDGTTGYATGNIVTHSNGGEVSRDHLATWGLSANSAQRSELPAQTPPINVTQNEWSLVSTGITMPEKGVYRVTGNFTLLGVTKEVTFRMKKIGEGADPWGGYRAGFLGTYTMTRADFGIDYEKVAASRIGVKTKG